MDSALKKPVAGEHGEAFDGGVEGEDEREGLAGPRHRCEALWAAGLGDLSKR